MHAEARLTACGPTARAHRAQDFHWINSPDNVTWRPHEGGLSLPEEGWVNFPLKDVIDARKMAGVYDLRSVPDGQVRAPPGRRGAGGLLGVVSQRSGSGMH